LNDVGDSIVLGIGPFVVAETEMAKRGEIIKNIVRALLSSMPKQTKSYEEKDG
jgi:hypothetical protein